ncbi:MAG: methyl-accepting chemotaxis protein [Rhodocyclaceae bacterium]|nr:methyl-accepting chemotaxis protein [Rhodocyclaceae bacterium]
MEHMTVRGRLTLLVALALAAIAVVGAVGWYGIHNGAAAIEEIGGNRLPSVEGLDMMAESRVAIRANNLTTAIWENDYNAQEKFAGVLARRKELFARLEKGWKLYEPLPQTAEEEVIWKEFLQAYKEWTAGEQGLADTIDALAKNKGEAGQKALFADFYKRFEALGPKAAALDGPLRKLVELNVRLADEAVAAGRGGAARAQTIMAVIGVAALALLAFLGLAVARSITSTLGGEPAEAAAAAARIASGDLAGEVGGGAPEQSLLGAMRRMQRGLRDVVGQIQGQADQVQSASAALYDTSRQISEAANHQSESTASMAAAMEELTVSISHVSDNAAQVSEVSRTSGAAAQSGVDVIRRLDAEMARIASLATDSAANVRQLDEMSGQISSVVQIIHEIADQTNLLALNAAIEAARAGEQGRGFAVVADEVRKLAERTSTSTVEIRGMITKVGEQTQQSVRLMAEQVEQVRSGTALAAEALASMTTIAEGSGQAVQAFEDIANSVREQSGASTQLARNIESVANMTEETSASVAESASGAQQLQNLAGQMRDTVRHFRL